MSEIIVAGKLHMDEKEADAYDGLKLQDEKRIGEMTYRADEVVMDIVYRACEKYIGKTVMITIKVDNLDPEDKT